MKTQVTFIMSISSVRNNLKKAKSDNLVLKEYVKTMAIKALDHDMERSQRYFDQVENWKINQAQ